MPSGSGENVGLGKAVNASGYPFQLAVEEQVRATGEKHGWDVETTEHPWRRGESAGFIDLVLKHTTTRTRLVIECKRFQHTSWVFLVPKRQLSLQRRIKLQWTNFGVDVRTSTGWFDFGFRPESHEASFCVVESTKQTQANRVETIARELLDSVEGLAMEQASIEPRGDWDASGVNRQNLFIPTILTTANLVVCHLDPESVELDDGILRQQRFEKVGLVRFRKSLTTEFREGYAPRDIEEGYQDRVRTILIVNSGHLLDFLERWEPEPVRRGHKWPWDPIRSAKPEQSSTQGGPRKS